VVVASLHNQLRARPKYEWAGWSEAAEYMLDNKLSADEALADANQSIAIEDRFENEMDKSRALDALNRADDAKAARAKAMSVGSQQQVHSYGRQLQNAKKNDEALEIFRANVKKDPNSWIGHNETARLAVAKGDYDTALKEMKLSQAGLPEALRPQLDAIIKRLENKEDINK
jgi:tetratricopeptide (TPR) repeat protein